MPSNAEDYPIKLFTDRDSWARWLREHHASEQGIWLRFAKAASALESVSYSEALDLALCHGWIDGQKRTFDSDSWLLKFTPRRKRSVWSKKNREHVERLIRSGEMHPAGLAQVEAAKADGRWDRAYDSPANAMIPEDFQAALDSHPEAAEFFATLKSASRYSMLYRIQTAVKPETRARRVSEYIEMLSRGETLG